MGKGWEGIEASSVGGENKWLGTCKAHHVGIIPQEDRRRAAGTVGEDEGAAEKGGLEPREPAARMRAGWQI